MSTYAPGHDDLRVEAGISYRQLDYWIRRGFISGVTREMPNDGRPLPSTPGSGYPREFAPHIQTRIVTLGRLVHAGMSPEGASRLAPGLAQAGVAVIDDVQVQWALTPKTIAEQILGSGEMA